MRKNNDFENSEGDNEINLVRDQTIFYNQQTTESCSINRSCSNKNKTDQNIFFRYYVYIGGTTVIKMWWIDKYK